MEDDEEVEAINNLANVLAANAAANVAANVAANQQQPQAQPPQQGGNVGPSTPQDSDSDDNEDDDDDGPGHDESACVSEELSDAVWALYYSLGEMIDERQRRKEVNISVNVLKSVRMYCILHLSVLEPHQAGQAAAPSRAASPEMPTGYRVMKQLARLPLFSEGLPLFAEAHAKFFYSKCAETRKISLL